MTLRLVEARPVGRYRSELERCADVELQAAGYTTAYESVVLRHRGRVYTPDFLAVASHAPRLCVEVKPSVEIARAELRHDMLVNDSPLWFVCDVFVVAFGWDQWVCRGVGSAWNECALYPAFDVDREFEWEGVA